MKRCNFAGKKRSKHTVVIKKRGKIVARFKASGGCAPGTKPQRKLAAVARACKAKGVKARGKGRRGFTKEWRSCLRRGL